MTSSYGSGLDLGALSRLAVCERISKRRASALAIEIQRVFEGRYRVRCRLFRREVSAFLTPRVQRSRNAAFSCTVAAD
jgi:hypothetical protein